MKIRRDGKAYDGGDATITALGQVWEEVTGTPEKPHDRQPQGYELEHGQDRPYGKHYDDDEPSGGIGRCLRRGLVEHQAVSYQCDIRGRL